MVESIDTLPIKIEPDSFRESCKFQGTDVDIKLGTQGHQRQHWSYGSADVWSFTCVEDADSVAWADSVALAMIIKCTSGAPAALVISFGTQHSLPTPQNVYILNVKVWYNQSTTTRYFNLTVRGV